MSWMDGGWAPAAGALGRVAVGSCRIWFKVASVCFNRLASSALVLSSGHIAYLLITVNSNHRASVLLIALIPVGT